MIYINYTKEMCIEAIQKFVKENKAIPNMRDFLNNSSYPRYTIISHLFGSWNTGIIAAGFVPDFKGKNKYTKERCIKAIQKWAIEHNGIPPTQRDFSSKPKYPSYKTVQNMFGTWNNAIISAGFKPDDNVTRGRIGELHNISEFKMEGVVDLSGQNRCSSCDGICPKGELFDTKSASLMTIHGSLCWVFCVTEKQLEEAGYLFLRAYKNKDFTKQLMYKWRIPIDLLNNRKQIVVYKDIIGSNYNIENMKKYEI